MQNLTFGRQELFKAAANSWTVWKEGNVTSVPNAQSMLEFCARTLKGPAPNNLCWLFSMTLLHNCLAVCKWFSKAVM